MTIEIPLSLQGTKYKGMYSTIVDDEDGDLAKFRFRVVKGKTTDVMYAVMGDRPAKSLHRIILERMLEETGATPLADNEFPDHIDGNGLNNSRSNLRRATKSTNGMNRGAEKNSWTGYKGVSWHKHRKKYRARIKANGKEISLGYYVNIEDAIKARDEAELLYFGDYGRPNRPTLSE